MEILEAYDLAGTLRGAAQLAGCDHKTVAHWVGQRELGLVPKMERKRPAMEADYQWKIEELCDGTAPGGATRPPLPGPGGCGDRGDRSSAGTRRRPVQIDDSGRRRAILRNVVI
jgi:hypothetical protein